MINRRLLFALPFMIAVPALAQPTDAQPTDALAAALVACWEARGIRFTAAQVTARIAGHTGKAALLAVAGATESADGDEVETAVEVVWEAGAPPSPAEPLLTRDLADRLPVLLLARDGQWWLLTARYQELLVARHPISGQPRMFDMSKTVLIGRPVIAGA